MATSLTELVSEAVRGRSDELDVNVERLALIATSAINEGQETVVLDQLDGIINETEGQVETLCDEYHQRFVDSVEQILGVKEEVRGLRKQLRAITSGIMETGGYLKERNADLLQSQKCLSNMDEASAELQRCLNVLRSINKILAFIERRENYAALKALDDTGTMILADVNQYDFEADVRSSIPAMKRLIQDAVQKDISEWLLYARDNCKAIGSLQMQLVQQRRDIWRERVAKNRSLRDAKLNGTLELVLNEKLQIDPLSNDNVSLDFRTLHEGFHIQELLGLKDSFRVSFEEDRRRQKDLLLMQPFVFTSSAGLDEFRGRLESVLGFVIIEERMLETFHNFRSAKEFSVLWHSICETLSELIKESLQKVNDLRVFIQVKQYLSIFIQAVEPIHGSNELANLSKMLSQLYSDTLLQTQMRAVADIINELNFDRIFVRSLEELESVQEEALLQQDNTIRGKVSFPLRLPYSAAYVDCSIAIKQYIEKYGEFFKDDELGDFKGSDTLLSGVDALMSEAADQFSQKLKSQNIAQAVQIYLNSEQFQHLHAAVSTLMDKKWHNRQNWPIVLHSPEKLERLQKTAEQRVFELINLKMDDFLELSNYDWTSIQPQAGPNSYILEMVQFLQVTFRESLPDLPQHLKTFVYFEAFDHLATYMLGMLMNESGRKVTDCAIQNFSKDVLYLEQFLDQLGDANVPSSEIFMELRQSINLLLSENSEEYVNNEHRNKAFNRVKPENAERLLEKLLASHSYMNMTQQSRQKRRSIEATLAAIRGTSNRDSSSGVGSGFFGGSGGGGSSEKSHRKVRSGNTIADFMGM